MEFLLVQRGLITNPLINKKDEKKNPDGKAQLESSGVQKMETKAELPEEELKAKSVRGNRKRAKSRKRKRRKMNKKKNRRRDSKSKKKEEKRWKRKMKK